MKKVKILCRPCGEAQGKKAVRIPMGRDIKVTCECCGRRRYGYKYELEEGENK